MIQKEIDHLQLQIFDSRANMGKQAADDIEKRILDLLSKKNKVRMIFASAPSQDDVLGELKKKGTIDWSRIEAFHMDEYLGLEKGDPRLFSEYIVNTLFKPVGLEDYNLIDPSNEPTDECRRYSDLIKEEPIDIVCMGIGENGHIAFNEPEYAKFNDSEIMKIVSLDLTCRNQQVHDGCFSSVEKVPEKALTLTIPALFNGTYIFCVVPGSTKKKVLNELVLSEVRESLPCSILKKHDNCVIYTDQKIESVR